MNYENLVGKKIRIVALDDPYADRYIGKEGIVERVSTDPWGDVRLDGTWGGIAIYPHVDSFEVIDDETYYENGIPQ